MNVSLMPQILYTTVQLLTSGLSDARNHGLRPFSVYQGQWSAAQRGFERDVLPMARDEGMALAPWGVLGGGNCKHLTLHQFSN